MSVSETAPKKLDVRIPEGWTPEGWTLEELPRQAGHVLLSTPSHSMATIDFRARGFRSGFSTTAKFVGEEWNKRRKNYGGRGWKQALVEHAVAHLRTVES